MRCGRCGEGQNGAKKIHCRLGSYGFGGGGRNLSAEHASNDVKGRDVQDRCVHTLLDTDGEALDMSARQRPSTVLGNSATRNEP